MLSELARALFILATIQCKLGRQRRRQTAKHFGRGHYQILTYDSANLIVCSPDVIVHQWRNTRMLSAAELLA